MAQSSKYITSLVHELIACYSKERKAVFDKYVTEHPLAGLKKERDRVVHALVPMQQAAGSSKKMQTNVVVFVILNEKIQENAAVVALIHLAYALLSISIFFTALLRNKYCIQVSDILPINPFHFMYIVNINCV